MPASVSNRGSGAFTPPTLSVTPPKPAVSAGPRVTVLKTVFLPEPARPTMAICMGRSSQRSVAGARVHHVEERFARGESAEGVAEQVDRAVEDAAARPGRVRRDYDVRMVVEVRRRGERLVAERVEYGAAEMTVVERPEESSLVDQAATGDV